MTLRSRRGILVHKFRISPATSCSAAAYFSAASASASPPWWDSPAYAEILEAASNFSFTHKKLNHIAPNLRLGLAGIDPLCGSLQKKMYQALVDNLYIPDDHFELVVCL